VPRVHALLLAADAAEKSKTPFYIVGGVLAAWAVIVAFAGITQPEFPRNSGGRVAVIVVTACLVAGAMAAAVATA
jgi:hypothetical protein